LAASGGGGGEGQSVGQGGDPARPVAAGQASLAGAHAKEGASASAGDKVLLGVY